MEKDTTLKVLGIVFLLICWSSSLLAQKNVEEETIFQRSLHYTAKGMAYWYDKANGGLESITGIPYSELGCKNCHVEHCDRCHLDQSNNLPAYSTSAARQQDMCLQCHAREAAILKIDREADQVDIHAAKGMSCMDCHSAREMHGDGIEYVSMKQFKAMDAKCEKCHTTLGESTSHTIHQGKVDCQACHDRHVVSCTNCHFETLVSEGKRVAIPVSGWTFLMNYNGKVTSANMQTFVVKGDQTFLMFAPQHSHSVMATGRTCAECHATKIVKQVRKGKAKLTWLKDGRLENLKGVIPVVENMNWQMVYQDRKEGQWVPIGNPSTPKIHYAGFGEPLTAEQMKKLLQKQGEKK
jgi:hypothetical protein